MPSDGPLLGAPEAEARLAADEAPTFAPAVVPLGAGRVARVDRRWYFDSRYVVPWRACGSALSRVALRRFLRVYVAVCIVIPSFGVIYTWAATDALDGTADPWCGAEHPVLFWCYQTFAVLVVLVAVPLSWRIREVHDQFFIKREMAALVAICIAVHLVLTAFGAVWSEERELQFPLQHYLAMMQSVAFVVLALALPIRRSYDEEAAGQAAQATLSAAAGAADADDELAGVLATKDEREVLMRFLVESFCPETLVFWEAVADYRRRVRALVAKRRGPARQLRAARAHAQRVYAKFVARNAPVEVNLPSALARPLHEALAEGGGSHLGEGRTQRVLLVPSTLSVSRAPLILFALVQASKTMPSFSTRPSSKLCGSCGMTHLCAFAARPCTLMCSSCACVAGQCRTRSRPSKSSRWAGAAFSPFPFLSSSLPSTPALCLSTVTLFAFRTTVTAPAPRVACSAARLTPPRPASLARHGRVARKASSRGSNGS
jgi:hypothetical protein